MRMQVSAWSAGRVNQTGNQRNSNQPTKDWVTAPPPTETATASTQQIPSLANTVAGLGAMRAPTLLVVALATSAASADAAEGAHGTTTRTADGLAGHDAGASTDVQSGAIPLRIRRRVRRSTLKDGGATRCDAACTENCTGDDRCDDGCGEFEDQAAH